MARRLEDVLKTSWRRLEDEWTRPIYWSWSRRLGDVWLIRICSSSSRCLEDVLKMSFEEEAERCLHQDECFPGSLLPFKEKVLHGSQVIYESSCGKPKKKKESETQ